MTRSIECPRQTTPQLSVGQLIELFQLRFLCCDLTESVKVLVSLVGLGTMH
jgi:hypothetical protein